jgi:hypothetical protein
MGRELGAIMERPLNLKGGGGGVSSDEFLLTVILLLHSRIIRRLYMETTT